VVGGGLAGLTAALEIGLHLQERRSPERFELLIAHPRQGQVADSAGGIDGRDGEQSPSLLGYAALVVLVLFVGVAGGHARVSPNDQADCLDLLEVVVLLFCGLRRQELVNLELTDVDMRSRWLKVRKGKGGKGRSIPLAQDAAEAIRDWLEFRPEVDHEYLLTGLGGRRLDKNGLVRVFLGRRSARA
jgi:hypothetical protein